jgi:hypothetical protein
MFQSFSLRPAVTGLVSLRVQGQPPLTATNYHHKPLAVKLFLLEFTNGL